MCVVEWMAAGDFTVIIPKLGLGMDYTFGKKSDLLMY